MCQSTVSIWKQNPVGTPQLSEIPAWPRGILNPDTQLTQVRIFYRESSVTLENRTDVS